MKHWKTKFALLGVGQAASILTSSILQMAIIWHLTERTGSPVIITLSTLAGYLPRAVLGLFTGAFIDRYDRKKIVMLSDGGIALAALLLAVVSLRGQAPIWLIFVILCIRSMGAAFHAPALNAMIPSFVPQEELPRCAGFLQGFESVSMILSPALAAVLYAVWDLSAIVLLDVGGAAVAIAMVCLLRLPKSDASTGGETVHIWRDTKEGIEVLRRDKSMMAIMVISTVYAFIYFPIGSMYPLITMTYFGGSVADSSVVEIAFSSGTLVGALLLGWLGKRLNKVLAIAASIGIYGLGVMTTGLLPPGGLRVFMVLSVFLGVTIPFFHGLKTAIFQSGIPNEYLGRVLSLSFSISLFAAPMGLLLGGGFSEFMGVQNCFLICGILAICLSSLIFLLPSLRNCLKKSGD